MADTPWAPQSELMLQPQLAQAKTADDGKVAQSARNSLDGLFMRFSQRMWMTRQQGLQGERTV